VTGAQSVRSLPPDVLGSENGWLSRPTFFRGSPQLVSSAQATPPLMLQACSSSTQTIANVANTTAERDHCNFVSTDVFSCGLREPYFTVLDVESIQAAVAGRGVHRVAEHGGSQITWAMASQMALWLQAIHADRPVAFVLASD
jgi:hypothetical protein